MPFLFLPPNPIACPHCRFVGARTLTYCPRCGCLMRLRGEVRYPGIDLDYQEQRTDPVEPKGA